jgi:multicomponent Na+:H+ antiporter subunit F
MIFEADLSQPMEWTVNIVLVVLAVALVLAFVRLFRGPSLPDRVVALDLIAAIVVGIFAVYAIVMDQPVFIDAAIVLALIIFLGTVAFARYTERRGRP